MKKILFIIIREIAECGCVLMKLTEVDLACVVRCLLLLAVASWMMVSKIGIDLYNMMRQIEIVAGANITHENSKNNEAEVQGAPSLLLSIHSWRIIISQAFTTRPSKRRLQCTQTRTELTVTSISAFGFSQGIFISVSSWTSSSVLVITTEPGETTGMALGRNPGTHSAVRMRQRRNSMP